MEGFIQYLPAILAAISSLFLYVFKKWRWNILALGFIYISAFWMVLQLWPIGLAVVKLITGWMAAAILGSSVKEDLQTIGREEFFEQRFRFVLVILIWIFTFSITQQISEWLPVPNSIIWGGLILIFMGILQFGMSIRPIRVIFGLMTTLAGFEVLYAGVEKSVLVAGFQAMITLGIALVGVIFIQQEEGEII